VQQAQLEGAGQQMFYSDVPRQQSIMHYIPPVTYLVGNRGRMMGAYPFLNIDHEGSDCDAPEHAEFRSLDGTCNTLAQPKMGAAGQPFARNTEASEPHPEGMPEASDVAEILRRPADGGPKAWFNQVSC
jgi:hypothetical protein